MNARTTLLALLLAALTTIAMAAPAALPEPAAVIPWCATPPTVDGKLTEGEWDNAAVITMLASFYQPVANTMREMQPRFYVCWDETYLYIAMDSLESSTNRVMAGCVQTDNTKIIGDDCVEIMVAPGDLAAVSDPDFPTYYLAANAIGTIWDAMFKPLRAESYKSWQSAMDLANSVDGSRWICELRVPFSSMAGERPHDGTVWRMNFDRTYYAYKWSGWNTSGHFNDARVGGNVTFSKGTLPTIRLTSVEELNTGHLGVVLEAVNPGTAPAAVTCRITATGHDDPGTEMTTIGTAEQTVTVAAGGREEIALGGKQLLRRFNIIAITVTDSVGKVLYTITRRVQCPSPRIPVQAAPDLPLVYIFPRFLPSLERLAVSMDATAWLKRTGLETSNFSATVTVAPKATPDKPVIDATYTDFSAGKGVARFGTKDLPEGEYVVQVRVRANDREIIVHDDWFEKRVFPWMVNPVGVPKQVPEPWTPLVVEGSSVRPWGRDYRFAPTGLPAGLDSQQKPLLAGPVTLDATVDGQAREVTVSQPFAVTRATGLAVDSTAALAAGDLAVTIDSSTEFDGLTIFHVTCAAPRGPVTVNRLRLRVPLTGKYCRFYSASGDKEGTNIQGAVVPTAPGKWYDSSKNTYAIGGFPTFSTLLWIGDYDSYWSYQADNPKGWAVRDDAPAVEAWNDGDQVVVWLNLIDRDLQITQPRTLEFAFQTGPTKPLPPHWRGIQYAGDPQAAPQTVAPMPGSGGGFTLYGGPNFIHPGFTPEMIEKSRERVAEFAASGPYKPVGYHRWPMVDKGHPATRVFRGEWGYDRGQWEAAKQVKQTDWPQRRYGPDRDMYVRMLVDPVPSYVDYLEYSYDLALTATDLYGTYDDTGSPISIYDEELGLGYIADDGRKVSSSGLWIYRDRWKRAAVIHALHKRENFLCDSQHTQAHYQAAYGFIGLWRPCERGFYNMHKDRDNYEFYGSLERYYAYNPSHAFGQVACGIGMGSPQQAEDLLARDTRTMMMMALLHDQDVGSFGNRDDRTVWRLREARNVFRQWEDDVGFIGYWQSAALVRADNPACRVSLYRRPGSALLFIGNTGDATTARIEPNWKALAVGPEGAGDPLIGENLPLRDGGFSIDVERHGIRLVLIGDLSAYPWRPAPLGADLPAPQTVLAELSDPLHGPQLDPAWTVDVPDGAGSIGFVDDACYVQVPSYGCGHIRRPLGEDNVIVQCLILGTGTGARDDHALGLGLWWENGAYARVIPGCQKKQFHYDVAGQRVAPGRDVNTDPADRWYPYYANGVRIQLTPATIRFSVSTDGKTWELDKEIERGEALAGPPAFAIVGSGAVGEAPYFANVNARHFKADRWTRTGFVTNFVVGRDQRRPGRADVPLTNFPAVCGWPVRSRAGFSERRAETWPGAPRVNAFSGIADGPSAGRSQSRPPCLSYALRFCGRPGGLAFGACTPWREGRPTPDRPRGPIPTVSGRAASRKWHPPVGAWRS